MKWYQMRWAQKYWGKEARERYQRYLQSDAWQTKRKSVLQAAVYTFCLIHKVTPLLNPVP